MRRTWVAKCPSAMKSATMACGAVGTPGEKASRLAMRDRRSAGGASRKPSRSAGNSDLEKVPT